MPAGNITQKERMERMLKVKELMEDGLTPSQIATELGMTLPTVKRNAVYLEQLQQADLTAQEMSERRGELYLELMEATAEAKALFDDYKVNGEPIHAKYMFAAWMDSIELRAKLYGLTQTKIDVNTQINTLNEYNRSADKLPAGSAEVIKKAVLDAHQKRVGNA
jgi:predicted transcriptional regulator